jgi:hypothetical protein
MKLRVNKRKGVFVIDAILFSIVALSICVFAWDVSRVMYYKVYNQNLASTLAVSVVNESGYYYQDSTGKTQKGYLVTSENTKTGMPKGFTGGLADQPGFLENLRDRNLPYGTDCTITDVNLNDHYHYNNWQRFNTGSDGVNGEAQVKTTLKIKMFLPNIGILSGGKAGKDYVEIQNIATAVPLFSSSSVSTGIDWNSLDGEASNSGYEVKYYQTGTSNNGYQVGNP